MANRHFQKLLSKQMTRQEFLGFSAVMAASVFGIVGLIEELKSHAATPATSVEAENGTIAGGGAAAVTDTTASGGKAVMFAPAPSASTTVGAVSGIARKVAGTYGGHTYIALESIDTGGSIVNGAWKWGSGQSLQTVSHAAAAAGKIITFPACDITWSYFGQVNSTYGINLTSGGCVGWSGSGEATRFYQVPGTVSAASLALIPTQEHGGTNPLSLVIINGVSNFVVDNLQFSYSDEGCLYNGLRVAEASGAVITNCWFQGCAPGDNSANPGETFMLNVWNSTSTTITNCTFDGRTSTSVVGTIDHSNPGTTSGVTGSNVGFNGATNVTVNNCLSQWAGYGHGFTAWETADLTYTNCYSINLAHRSFNNEQGAAGSVTWNSCGSYNSNNDFIFDDYSHSQTIKINDHVTAAGAAPSTGRLVNVKLDTTELTKKNIQKQSDINYYRAGVLYNAFMAVNNAESPKA